MPHLQIIPPLGILYLASSLKEAGFKVKIVDMEVEKLGLNTLEQILQKTYPTLVGISCTSPLFPIVQKISQTIKRLNPNIYTLIGGPHPTIDPHSVLKEQSIDFLIRGEGEYTIVELMETNLSIEKTSTIRGLSYKKNGHQIHNPNRPLISNLDELPFPDRKMIPYKKYFAASAKQNPCTSLITSRGCPYRCIFCSNIFHQSRFRSAQNVVDEMELILNQLRIQDIEILDSTFNLKKQLILDICKEISKRKLDIYWRCICRVDLIDREILKYLKAAGCYLITYGVESGSDRILKILQKGFTISQVNDAFKITKKMGFETHGLFMVGVPGETQSEIKKTIKFSQKLDPDYAQFFITTPLPGSKLFEMALKNKWIPQPDKMDYYDFLGIQKPLMKFPNLSQKEIEKLHKRAIQHFFFRFRYILKFLAKFLKEPKRFIKNSILTLKYLIM
ncbi:MAG: B12-binding domain-containing radical SAM protein [Candidatus Helarchaeota archaeon]